MPEVKEWCKEKEYIKNDGVGTEWLITQIRWGYLNWINILTNYRQWPNKNGVTSHIIGINLEYKITWHCPRERNKW